jgi:DNA-binding LytR/AlgR family response regulator
VDDLPAAPTTSVRVIMCLTFDRRAPPHEIESAKAAIIACTSVLHSVELTGTYDFMFEAEIPDMASYNAQLSICAEPMARLVARYEANFVCKRFIRASSRDRGLWVPHNGAMKRIDCRAVDKISAEGDYMRVHSAQQSWMLHSTMSAVGQHLGFEDFIQLHRSIIVRRGFIDQLSHSGRHWTAKLNDGTKERVARGSVTAMLQMVRLDSASTERAPSIFRAPVDHGTVVNEN